MYLAWRSQLIDILSRLGMKSVKELVGHFDVIAHLDHLKGRDIHGELV